MLLLLKSPQQLLMPFSLGISIIPVSSQRSLVLQITTLKWHSITSVSLASAAFYLFKQPSALERNGKPVSGRAGV